MKKIIIFTLLFGSILMNSFGQKDLSGTYFEDPYSYKIEITGNEFKYIQNEGKYLVIWSNDTLAQCTFKWIDDNFIELNSIPPWMTAGRSISVKQFLDPTVKDSLKVSFSMPYDEDNLEISVSPHGSRTYKTYNLNYSKNNKSLMLPNGINDITFYISPEADVPHTIDGAFYGVLFYPFFYYPIEKKINHVLIDIPAIDNSFFERYYVKGEYARVSGDTITWKGRNFVKKK